MKNFLKQIWQDERGALTTVEVIGYTVLIGGAVALVGFGLTTMARGKTSAITRSIHSLKASSVPVTESSTYTGTAASTDADTGIVTGITVTN